MREEPHENLRKRSQKQFGSMVDGVLLNETLIEIKQPTSDVWNLMS